MSLDPLRTNLSSTHSLSFPSPWTVTHARGSDAQMRMSSRATGPPTAIQPGPPEIQVPPTRKIHSPHSRLPQSLNLLQHQLQVQVPSAGQSQISTPTASPSGPDEARGLPHSGAQILSSCEPVQLSKQPPQNTKGQARDHMHRHSVQNRRKRK